MRLLLKLCARNEQKDISGEYHKLQGFVYNIIKESGYRFLHDMPGYKFFCFSNIFPPGNMKTGDLRNFIISSPNKDLINALADYLSKLRNMELYIGDASFTLKDIQTLEIALPKTNIIVSTATPIIIRIPETKYDAYQIPENRRMKRYVYWRQDIAFPAFLKQLTENLIKKYNDFYGTEIERYDLFEQFQFINEIHTRLIINGKSYGVSASIWEFMWGSMDTVQRRVIEFGLDTGFGERNSMGFGFVNPRTARKET